MNPVISRIGLFLKRHDKRVHSIVAELIPWLQSRGIQVFLDRASVAQPPSGCTSIASEELGLRVDLVAVFGGDGTLLHAARMVADSEIPILGVNLGSLGFLTEVTLEEMLLAFENVLSGNYRMDERMLLEVEVVRGKKQQAKYLALNDAVINKSALARIIEFEVTVNDQLVTQTRADGLIISTPTGSTAYSLSAGGPILYPSLEAFIITPICPHTLTYRPVVVPSSAAVGLCLRNGADVMLTVDGQVGLPLETGDHLKVVKARPTVRLVQATSTTFFQLLREKLKWG